jgi:hypothetical protein
MKRWFILEGFYASDSSKNPNRQPYDGLHVSLTCQQGNHPTGLTSALYSRFTATLQKCWPVKRLSCARWMVQEFLQPKMGCMLLYYIIAPLHSISPAATISTCLHDNEPYRSNKQSRKPIFELYLQTQTTKEHNET